MSARLRKQIDIEREQLGRLIDQHRPLLARCAESPPGPIELSALAAFLHGFYTGIENMFKRIRVELGQRPPIGEDSHQQLLRQMARPQPAGSAVISESTRQLLAEYMGFRHVFRHAYTFDLRWEKMSGLVLRAEQTLNQLQTELETFLVSIGQ